VRRFEYAVVRNVDEAIAQVKADRDASFVAGAKRWPTG